jgi:shikimate kinase
MNIVLIGYRCTGKTSVGKQLGAQLGRDFLDTDTKIEERAGRSIEWVVAHRGWEYFRRIERSVIKEISMSDALVIATGGGVVMDEENVENLRRNGWVVWLEGSAEVLRARMAKDQESGKARPALTGRTSTEEIGQVLKSRVPLYQRASHVQIDTNANTVSQVAAMIMRSLPKDCSQRFK